MGIFQQFDMNETATVEGIPVRFSPNDDGTIPTIYVGRLGLMNKRYSSAFDKLIEPWKDKIGLPGFTIPGFEDISREAFVRGCITKWENVQDENGVEIPFSVENALDLLKKLPELSRALDKASSDVANFRKVATAAIAKN